MLISLPLLRNLSPKIFLSICNIPKDLAKEPLKIFNHFLSPGGFFFFFASDFVCTDCFVCGSFVLVLPRMRAFQSSVGFRRRNCTQCFEMYSDLGASQ